MQETNFAHLSRTNIKRVVVTSSCAAVLTISKEPRTFTEVDWNEQATKEIEEKGRDALNISKYRASKTLGERGGPLAVVLVHVFTIHRSCVGLLREKQEPNWLGSCSRKPTFRECIRF